jgi:hypothetical protein
VLSPSIDCNSIQDTWALLCVAVQPLLAVLLNSLVCLPVVVRWASCATSLAVRALHPAVCAEVEEGIAMLGRLAGDHTAAVGHEDATATAWAVYQALLVALLLLEHLLDTVNSMNRHVTSRHERFNSGCRFQISDFKIQVSGFRFRISGFRYHISDFRFQISDFRFQISDFRFQNSTVMTDHLKSNPRSEIRFHILRELKSESPE